MNKSIVVMKHELKALFRSWTLPFAAVIFIAFGIYFTHAIQDPEAFSLVLPIISLTPIIFLPIIALPNQFVVEKKEKCIEALLSTPLTAKDIWIGKVATSTIVSYIISLLMFVGAAIAFSMKSQVIFLSPVGLFIVLLLNPAIGFTLIGIFGAIDMATAYETLGHFALFVVFFGYVYGLTPALKFLSRFSLSTEHMILIFCCAVLIVLGLIVLWLSNLLTEERVVRSE